MFCGNCGKEVRNEEVFCKNCGKRIDVHFNEEAKNEVQYNGGSMDKQTKLVIWIIAAIFGIALLCGIVVAHGKSLTNGKILKDEDIVNWIEGGIGSGYDIELTKVYDRETSENKILVYCEFVAQNESVKRVGKVCVEYRMQNGKWKVSYCSPIDYDNWERYPVKGVDYETVINDVKEVNNSNVSRIEILEQNTDLAAKTDYFKVQEIRTINQLNIVTTYEMIYRFGGKWESAVGSGRIIERKIDIDITGEWVGHQNGEYYYVNILECGEDGSISAEFDFPYERYWYGNIQIQGLAMGEIDLNIKNPSYALESEKVVSEDTEITSCWFWISFDEADLENQIRMTTSQGNTCVLERKTDDGK